MGWFSRKKRPALFVPKSDIKRTDHDLLMLVKYISLDPSECTTKVPSPEYYCSDQEIAINEVRLLVEKLSAQVHVTETIDVQLFSTEKNGYESVLCNRKYTSENPQAIFLPGGITQYPIHLNASIVQQLCELKVARITSDPTMIGEAGSALGFCYGFGIFHILSVNNRISLRNLHLSCISYEAMLYCAASLHEVALNSVDMYQYYVNADSWMRINEILKEIPHLQNRETFRKQWLLNSEHSADYTIISRNPLYAPVAVAALERLSTARPDDATLLHNLSYARLLLGQFESAIKGFDHVISGNPYHAYAFNNRGLSHLFLGHLTAALEDLQTASRLIPENSYITRNFGIYWLYRGQSAKAIEELRKAQQMNHRTAHIHYWLGRALLDSGMQDEALREFETSRQLPELPAPVYPMIS